MLLKIICISACGLSIVVAAVIVWGIVATSKARDNQWHEISGMFHKDD